MKTALFAAGLLAAGAVVLRAEPQVQFHVAVGGNDSNPGTEERPFATLEKARDAVRASNGGMTGDIVVFVHPGDYVLPRPLDFDKRDSGNNGHKVRYLGFGKPGSARLLGGERIQGWESHEGRTFKKKIGTEFRFDTLYENGERSPLARHPNAGYHRIEKNGPRSKAEFFYVAGDVPAVVETANLHVCAWLEGHDWDNDRVGVQSLDPKLRLITLRRDAHGGMVSGSRYYMEGAREFLDAPGEFYLDKAAGWLYYWPRSTPIEDQEIIAPRLSCLVRFAGASPDEVVEDIEIAGLTLAASNYDFDALEAAPGRYTDNGVVYMENARRITVKYCRILNAGLHGVNMMRWAQENTVVGNEIADCGYSGVNMAADGPTLREVHRGHTVSNNSIHHVGRLYHGYIGGVYLFYSGHNEIAHNDIRYSPRYGISLKGKAYSYMERSYDGAAVTFDNRKDFIPTRNNLVSCNDVSYCNLDSQDTGIVEAWGCGKDNVIENNRLHDSGSFTLQSGIYLDDDSSHVTVRNNIIYGINGDVYKRQPLFIKGLHNLVTNNVLDATGMDWDFLTMHYGGDVCHYLTITHNIFYTMSPQAECAYQFWSYDEDRISAADNNVFYHASGRYAVWGVPGLSTFEAWKKLKDGKFDAHSVSADPLFVDAAAHDYDLKPDSPALKLGFKPIALSGIGLKEDFPYARPPARAAVVAPQVPAAAKPQAPKIPEPGPAVPVMMKNDGTADGPQEPLLMPLRASQAQDDGTIMAEGFENPAGQWPPLFHRHWGLGYGSTSASEERSHTGSSSYKIDENQEVLFTTFDEPLRAVVTLWFYDNGGGSELKCMARVDRGPWDGDGWRGLGVDRDVSKTHYAVRIGNESKVTSVERTAGWHEFKWDYNSGNKLDMGIDGNPVASVDGDSAFRMIALGDWWETGFGPSFFDDVLVTRRPSSGKGDAAAVAGGEIKPVQKDAIPENR